ncbi:MAG: polyphosphate polymerase domain-containing protein [Lachnospiraceae bacterium]|nr:polyphosphate polymerase domain-containing protein [Lachnospiraceae bacterium]
MEYEGHTLRHELKYYINYDVYHVLRKRLQRVIQMDGYMPDEEGYLVSSLYFDDCYHSALEEKMAGTQFRKKFRIRSYELNDGLIRLECKAKYNEYISKTSARISLEEYRLILNGQYGHLITRKETVCRELFCYNRTKCLKPAVVVEYRREAYVSPLGNVRITFDKDIRASTGAQDMFSSGYHTSKVLPDGIMVLEVKYDDYIPSHILGLLQTAMTDRCAISKYVMCREEKRRVKFI